MDKQSITQAQQDFILLHLSAIGKSLWTDSYETQARDPKNQVVITSKVRQHRQFAELEIKVLVYKLEDTSALQA